MKLRNIGFKSNKTNLFKEKWKIFEETILTDIESRQRYHKENR